MVSRDSPLYGVAYQAFSVCYETGRAEGFKKANSVHDLVDRFADRIARTFDRMRLSWYQLTASSESTGSIVARNANTVPGARPAAAPGHSTGAGTTR